MKDLKLIPLLLITFAVLSRLLPHPANFAPISAVALFGAVYLPKKFAFILPLSAMLISDFFIGFYGMEMLFVYGSFLITGAIGLYLKNHKNAFSIVVASFISSILFYLITNFGVWVTPGSMYEANIKGLIQSYVMAIPFFRNTLLGDLSYTGLLFGTYELLFVLSKRYFKGLVNFL